MDSGLCGLSLVAGYYRIAGDPVQLRHQLALRSCSAQAEEIVPGADILRLKLRRILRKVTARRLGAIPFPVILGLKEGGFAVLGAGSAKELARSCRSDQPDSARAVDGGYRGAILRRGGPRNSI